MSGLLGQGFNPQLPVTLESFRCLRCLLPFSAGHESKSTNSTCAWCVGERATDYPTHWCERGGHPQRLEYANYNAAENLWDCGYCPDRHGPVPSSRQCPAAAGGTNTGECPTQVPVVTGRFSLLNLAVDAGNGPHTGY